MQRTSPWKMTNVLTVVRSSTAAFARIREHATGSPARLSMEEIVVPVERDTIGSRMYTQRDGSMPM
eukprot:gene44252-56806_t